MNDELPAPLVPAECDLTDFKNMPLEVEQLRKSKSWLIAKRRPELAFFMLNLWMRAWHERPCASIENDDDVLADAAGAHPRDWPEIREDVLRGWVSCADGRLYHPVIAEKALEAWSKKIAYRWEKERDRQRKEWKRAGREGAPITPTLEEYIGQHFPGAVQFVSAMFPPDKLVMSSGKPDDVHRTDGGSPAEIPLKGEGKGEVRDRESLNLASLGAAIAAACAAAQARMRDEARGPEIIRLPTNRFNTAAEEFPLFESQVVEFEKLYPAVDVRVHLRNMRGWLISNTDKRKTAKGMMRFVNSWLEDKQNKAQSNGGRGTAGGAQSPNKSFASAVSERVDARARGSLFDDGGEGDFIDAEIRGPLLDLSPSPDPR